MPSVCLSHNGEGGGVIGFCDLEPGKVHFGR